MPYVPSEKTDGKSQDRTIIDSTIKPMADAIVMAAAKWQYDGAFLGELNYALTRLLQEIPRSLMTLQGFKDETRYWIQAGLFGVLLDVVLEYKRRVNIAYEANQIVKSGDCYDTPYYTRLIELVDEKGTSLGYQEVMMKRSDLTLNLDVLKAKIVVK